MSKINRHIRSKKKKWNDGMIKLKSETTKHNKLRDTVIRTQIRTHTILYKYLLIFTNGKRKCLTITKNII